MSPLRIRLLGLAATLSLLGFVAGVPLVLLALGDPPTVANLTWANLTARDDGTLALTVCQDVAWIAWAIFTITVVADLAARIRGIHTPRIPGLALPQLASGRLVAAGALLFVTIPTLATVTPTPRAVAAATAPPPPPAPPSPARAAIPTATRPATTVPEVIAPAPVAPQGPPTPTRASAHPSARPAPVRPTPAEQKAERTGERYTVKRGDSLWRIAEQQLGDGTRYVELLDLNRDVLGPRPDFLLPGTVLRIPAKSEPDPEASYIVEPGDTLSQIAQSTLGDANEYREIFEDSRTTVQPDGEHLTNPNLIQPGWRLTLPERESDNGPGTGMRIEPGRHRPQPVPHHHADPPTTRPASPPADPLSQRREPTPSSRTANTAPDNPRDTAQDSTHASAQVGVASWVLPGLAGASAALAGSLLIVLRQRRRTQLRYRRPGHVIAPPPADLRPVEKSAEVCGSVTAPRIDALDLALRSLEDQSKGLRLLTAALGARQITLRLAAAAELPSPWTGAETTWRIPIDEVTAENSGEVAPFPLLVSLGQAQDGAWILLNLEEIGSAALTGEPGRAAALARHIAAELALNPWSGLVETHTIGVGAGLDQLDTVRLQSHAEDAVEFVNQLADELAGELAAEWADGHPVIDPDPFRVLIATPAASVTTGGARNASTDGSAAILRLAEVLRSGDGRPGAAVLVIGGDPAALDLELHLTGAGRIQVEQLGLDLAAAGLSVDEAQACAALLKITADFPATTVPAADPEGPADATGALKPDLTEPRPANRRAGERSLLPLEVHEYEASSATTPEDVAALAPLTTAGTTAEILAGDPDLDDDLARWEAPMLTAPKLWVLGPVTARTTGEAAEAAKRRPFYVELLTYLVLHPHGATAAEVADAFGTSKDRARADLSILRHWLGKDLSTGRLYLPEARARQAHGERGAIYRTEGVLSDLDLFRRLRTRGQARGEAGIEDLVAALHLVTGEPFSAGRESGWAWLLDGERTDHLMTCAIVDVAHIVTAHALATDQLDLARFAAETAHHAAPYDETSTLDLITVAAATGHAGTAQRLLADGVFNRSDDDSGPIELPERTADLLRQRGWATRPNRRAQGA